jgi:hypothetical protein
MVRLEHKVIGGLHVFTSPDVPGLYAADRNEEIAKAKVEPLVERLHQMSQRRQSKTLVKSMIHARCA